MARKGKQTRRSVSIKGDVYWELRAFCEEHKFTMSNVTEELIKAYLAVVKKAGDKVARMDIDTSLPPSHLDDTPKSPNFTFIRKAAVKHAKTKPLRGGGVHEM